MRSAFIKTLEELATADPRIVLVVGDLGFRVVEDFAHRFPNQFVNAGVAEQHMTGLAVGLALSGKIVFTYSIGNFPTLRCLEQIRNDACYHRANLKVVSVGGGVAYGALGSSHHATEDIAIMRALPEMVVIAPGDPVEVKYATMAIAARHGPCYLRLGKAGESKVYKNSIQYRIGKAILVQDGSELTIISTGAVLQLCSEAANVLSKQGVSVRLLSMHTVKPIDSEAIYRAAMETDAILTVEEHSIIGGLGGAVAEVLAQYHTRRALFQILGLPDQFCKEIGGQSYLRSTMGLAVDNIVRVSQVLLKEASLSRTQPVRKVT